jgi:ABC-type dipeptide/oligopeptide/nickel transport system ATPase component
MVLQISDLHVQYRVGANVIKAVDGLDLEVGAGRILGIVGESGSGKSTLAQAILRLIDPPGRITAGSIRFQGQDLIALDERLMRALRGVSIALVMQNPGAALNPLMTIGHHYLEALQQHTDLDRTQAIERSVEMLRSVDLPDQAEMLGRYPHQLSGGMKQRAPAFGG